MPATDATSAFYSLSISAVVFSTLSALFGAYVVLFIFAVWATYRYPTGSHRRLRSVTVALFVVLVAHYTTRAINFAQSRVIRPPADEEARWSIPLTFVIEITSTVAGTLSDGLLAWRFYVVYGRARWALYVPIMAIALNTTLGLVGDFHYLSYYHSETEYENRMQEVAFEINAAWGWCMLGINTTLTTAMIWKILQVSRRADYATTNLVAHYRHNVIVEAIVESALVNWIGLVLYGITSLAPQGRITTHLDVGFVVGCALPMFFGISQCLITARLGFAAETAAVCLTCKCTRCNGLQRAISIMVHRETETDGLVRGHYSSKERVDVLSVPCVDADHLSMPTKYPE